MRKFFLWCGAALVGAGVIGLALARRTQPARADETKAPAVAQSSERPGGPATVRAESGSPVQQPTDGFSTGRARSIGVAATSAGLIPEPWELMAVLTQLDLSKGRITPEQAAKWKEALRQLASYGAAAVPAIREFLQKNQDIDFRVIRGGVLLGQSSLRTALLVTLREIGGPEAQDVMVQTLGVTASPTEIAMLGNFLDQMAPGRYRQQALTAASESLAMGAQGRLPGMDIGPLLQMMRNFDPAAANAAVEKLGPQYQIYAAMALAGLRDETGLPALIQALQEPAAGPDTDFRYQMLAQIGAQYPDASTVLVQLARQGRIPDSAWARIAMGLGGDQYGMFSFSPEGKPAVPSVPGIKTYHVEAGNQNFYSVPVRAVANPREVNLRQELIDQLLATKPPPAAVQALRQARDGLAGVVAQR